MAGKDEVQRIIGAGGSAPDYDIDYSDPRFGKVESDKSQALTELEQVYSGMIGSSDKYFNEQIEASKQWADKQQQIQQENTDFTIEQIEQEKEQAHKDYLKEQSGAYVDWQKQSGKYGVEAEKTAAAGLWGTGYSESSQVSMYNTYQNRVATARESYNKAVLNYNNAIKEAQLANNAALAELAYKALQEQLELSLQGFQYKNQLIIDQANKKVELDNMYYNRYLDVLEQINTENAMEEEIRQYNETMAWNTEQAELDREHQSSEAALNREYQSKQAELDRAFQSQQAEVQRKYQAAQAELDRKHDKELLAVKNQYEKEQLAQQHKNDMAKLAQQQQYELAQLAQQQKNAIAQLNQKLANEKALLAYQNSLTSKSSGSVSRSSGSSGSSGSVKKSSGSSKYPVTKSSNSVVKAQTAKAKSFTGTTYNQAVSYLKSKGINSAGVMTQSEWSRRKSSYSMTGIGNAAVKNYSSYSAYLRDYVNYTASNK